MPQEIEERPTLGHKSPLGGAFGCRAFFGYHWRQQLGCTFEPGESLAAEVTLAGEGLTFEGVAGRKKIR